jgi:SAM-dependent methyltransferase
MATRDSVQPALWRFDFAWMDGATAVQDTGLLDECASLFSQHYGIWSDGGPNPGGRVSMSPARVAKYLDNENAHLAVARLEGTLVGYAAALRLTLSDGRRIAWVTQLVVDKSYRHSRVATHLLFSIWQFSDVYACGLVTANPLAVRALETATRRPCKAPLIAERASDLLPVLSEASGYIPAMLVQDDKGKPAPKVDTAFALSLAELPELRERAARQARPWSLGDIDEGQEWLAATFRDQPRSPMSKAEIDDLMRGADDIWIQAYELMTLDERHAWHSHADDEVDLVLEATRTGRESIALDVGCGDGRHVVAMRDRGVLATGIDLAAKIDFVGNPSWRKVADARQELPMRDGDLVTCLYDVLGSSANPDDDRAILRSIFEALRPGGYLALSVMNEEVVTARLPDSGRPGTQDEFLAALESLPSSQTMETTGSVFDPNLILLYEGVFYRKEQFLRPGSHLPAELVVRDRRFSLDSIRRVVVGAGFQIDILRPVQAGQWRREPALDPTDSRAKELLVVAHRPSGAPAEPY